MTISDTDFFSMAKRAEEAFQQLSPSEKLRHLYSQRKSFARGMAPDDADYEEYCKKIDERMPNPDILSDAEIGLVLLGRYEK